MAESNRRNDKSPTHNQRNKLRSRESCRICRNNIENLSESSVTCSKCKCIFHCSCAGVSENFYVYYIQQKKEDWFCYTCLCAKQVASEANFDSIRNIEAVASKLNNDVQCLTSEILKIKNNDASWRQEFQLNITETIDKKIDERLAMLNHAPIRSTNEHQRTSNSQQSNSYRKNLIISGIPEVESENIVLIVNKLAKQIHFTQSAFIDNCFRIDRKTSPVAGRPPSILLKLTTELARDSFMKCYFSHLRTNQLTPADIGMSGNERIYVNEHMDPSLHPLLKFALKLRKEGKISQISSHSSHISVKTTSNGHLKWFRIKNISDFDTLQGPPSSDEELAHLE